MVDIQSVAAEIRRGKVDEEDRKKLQGKNIMAPLLHRAAIISNNATVEIMTSPSVLPPGESLTLGLSPHCHAPYSPLCANNVIHEAY